MGASESKLEFKEDIFRLAGEEDISLESDWWQRFIQLPETAEDVQALWSPADLRSLLSNTPAERPLGSTQVAPRKNVETLIYRTIGRLHALQTKRVFEDPLIPITPEVLNGVRILTRILPYIYEADHLADWEDRFFWQPRKPASYLDAKTNKPTYRDGLSEKFLQEEEKNKVIGPPLGEQLLDILIDYLFFPGFTLPPKKDANGLPDLKPTYTAWQSGIGANKGASMTKENERNATEVLRLLLALASRSMYFSPNIVAEKDIRPLTYLTTKADRTIVLNTICSLLNTVLKYNQNPWSFPIDLASGTKDPKQALVLQCMHLLLVLITYPVPNSGPNEFRKSLGRLHRAEDFQFIVEGLRQILMQPRLTTNAPPIAPETLSLFWELLQCNKRFRSYLIDTDRARDFVVLVLYYAVEAKDDPARQGLVRMCIFILQTLSVEEKFGKKLNAPFTFQETLPSVLQIPNFHGSYGDFLIGHLHGLLTSSNRGLETLHPALLAVINNVAPYLQDLQRATSSMLVNLFISMSQPSFLLANETNHLELFTLLNAMNAILENQYEENRRFVDIVLKSRSRFEALRDFTVDGALQELDRLNMERKDTGVKSPDRYGSFDTSRPTAYASRVAPGENPNDSAFAIGDDEDDDENTPRMSGYTSDVENSTSESQTTQSHGLSERAKGKQKKINVDTSAAISPSSPRNPPDPYVLSPTVSTAQPLYIDRTWLASWLPLVPLHTILRIIQDEQDRARNRAPKPTSTPSSMSNPTTAAATATTAAATSTAGTAQHSNSLSSTNSRGGEVGKLGDKFKDGLEKESQ